MSKYTVNFTMKLSYCKNTRYCQLNSFPAHKYIRNYLWYSTLTDLWHHLLFFWMLNTSQAAPERVLHPVRASHEQTQGGLRGGYNGNWEQRMGRNQLGGTRALRHKHKEKYWTSSSCHSLNGPLWKKILCNHVTEGCGIMQAHKGGKQHCTNNINSVLLFQSAWHS